MRKYTRRDILRLSAAAAVGSVVAACAPAAPQIIKETVIVEKEVIKEVEVPAKEPIEIVYWHGWHGRFADFLDRVEVEFHKANPDITVKFVPIAWDELYPKLLTAIAAGTPPDTMICGNETGQLYSLAAEEVIVPIEDIADPDEMKNLKEVVHPSIWEIGTYEGKLWALPKWTQSYAIYGNVEYLEEAGIAPEKPPQTFEELDAIAEELYRRDADGTIRRIGFDPGNWYFPWWGRFKGQYLDDKGEPSASHENNVKCIEWTTSYSKKYDPTKIAEFQEAVSGSGATSPFLTGQLALYQTGPWHTGDLYEFKRDMRYVVWPMPKPTWLDGKGMSTGGDIPVIPRGVKYPEASYKWCRYLIGVDNPEVYATLWTIGLRPHQPISEVVARGPAFDKVYEMFPGFDVYVDDFFGADWWAPPAKTPVAQFYADRINSWVQKARLLEVSPEEALQNAEKEAKDELAMWRAAH